MSEAVSQGTPSKNGKSENGPRSANGSGAFAASTGSLETMLSAMKAAQTKKGAPSYDERIANLERLERAVLQHKDALCDAISRDFGNRSKHETLIAEIFTTLNSIRHAKTHLHEWMEPEARPVIWSLMPARAAIQKQPLGVVGIISPWNYPVYLALDPLVGALAAGNRALLKPSELTPQTSELLKKLIGEVFDPEQVTVVTGGPEVGIAFSQLAFDHLVFTGSTSVGKLVMRAAAENLVPVTLELGGKSPAIVSDNYSLKSAAEKIIHGKLFNAGQTCIAPDYALVPKGRVDAFVEELKAQVAAQYPRLESNPDYTSIATQRHYDRLLGLITDAKEKGGKVVEANPAGESLSSESRKIAPTFVVGATDDMTVMQDEIFGPILPVIGYGTLDEAIEFVNNRPRPLALYYFDHDDRRVQRVLDHTVSGGVTINDTLFHAGQEDLPFGGVGPSGIGHYHGVEGFETFTKKKPIFYQSRLSGGAMLNAPYKKTLDTMLRFLIGR